MKKNTLKLAAVALLIGGSMTAASAQVRGVPGVDYGYPANTPSQATHNHSVTPHDSEQVYQNGKMIGQDPDANVRMMLRKDFTFQ